MPKEKGFYRAEEIDARGEREVNDPGEYPFTRGLYPEMYRKKKPTIRQFAGHGLAADTNKRFRMLLATGATGLSTAFDLPTLMGRDSDDPLALGQVGWDGVAVDTLADMEALFSDIAIGEVSVSMTVSGPAAIIWAMYLAMAKKRGVAFHELAGTLQNDILKEYAAQKEWLFPEEHGVRLVTDTILYAAEHVPKWHPVSVSGYHIREAGASAVEEIAFTLADGIEYVRHAVARGADVDSFAPQLSFFFDVHNNFMEEIAKLRAARALWARAMKERFNAKDPRSLWCRIHAQTAGCTLARQEPENNIVRVALQALAAMLGGVQSVHTNSYDEVLCTPTIEAVKRAVRTQQIIQEETGIASFPDALGGSFLLERMTCEMEAAAEAEIEKIEAMGGMLCAIRAGYPQRAIRTSALRYEEAVERGNIRIVGVNIYTEGEERGDPERIAVELAKRRDFEGRQKVSLAEVKRARDGSKVKEALQAVLRVAQTDENLMPALIEAVLAYATVGEIANTLKGVWGEYKERELFPVFSAGDESMHALFAKYRLKRPLRVLIAKGGLDGHDRIMWTLIAFLKSLGAEVIYPGLHLGMEEIAKRAVEEDVDVIGISTHIGSPVVLFERLKEHLNAAGADDMFLIGGGIVRDSERAALRELGVVYFAAVGAPFEEIARVLCEFSARTTKKRPAQEYAGARWLARFISELQDSSESRSAKEILTSVFRKNGVDLGHVVGITGSTAAGKSTLIDKMVSVFRTLGHTVAVLAVDPTEEESGGALLGDTVRMRDHYADLGVFLRGIGSRGAPDALAKALPEIIRAAAHLYDVIIVETMGARQTDTAIAAHVDTLVALPDTRGDAVNLLKAGYHARADILAVNTRGDTHDAEFARMLRGIAPAFAREGKPPPEIFAVNAFSGDGVEEFVRRGIIPRMNPVT